MEVFGCSLAKAYDVVKVAFVLEHMMKLKDVNNFDAFIACRNWSEVEIVSWVRNAFLSIIVMCSETWFCNA